MFELAPNSKRGLALRGPLVYAGGYGGEVEPEVLAHADAILTLPTSLRPRAPAWRQPRVVNVPGGFLVDRAGANPGWGAVLRESHRLWRRLSIPVILALAAEDVSHWLKLAARAGRSRLVSALECELTEELDPGATVLALKSETDLPLIAKIPIERAPELARALVESGADAVTIGLTPRGHAILNGTVWQGRLAGPIIRPLALRAVRAVAEQHPEVPIIAAGGAQTGNDVHDFMQAGACAVQIDSALWRDPTALIEIATTLNSARDRRRAPTDW
jgi:dihydroorotate dehydrogenase